MPTHIMNKIALSLLAVAATINIALALLALYMACSTGKILPRFVTDQQYQLLSDTDKARYERFFDKWSRILVPGDPGYVKTTIELTPEFVEAMSHGWAKLDQDSNIYRNRVNDKLKEAGPQDDPVNK